MEDMLCSGNKIASCRVEASSLGGYRMGLLVGEYRIALGIVFVDGCDCFAVFDRGRMN